LPEPSVPISWRLRASRRWRRRARRFARGRSRGPGLRPAPTTLLPPASLSCRHHPFEPTPTGMVRNSASAGSFWQLRTRAAVRPVRCVRTLSATAPPARMRPRASGQSRTPPMSASCGKCPARGWQLLRSRPGAPGFPSIHRPAGLHFLAVAQGIEPPPARRGGIDLRQGQVDNHAARKLLNVARSCFRRSRTSAMVAPAALPRFSARAFRQRR
jgi:hypothetical protein